MCERGRVCERGSIYTSDASVNEGSYHVSVNKGYISRLDTRGVNI